MIQLTVARLPCLLSTKHFSTGDLHPNEKELKINARDREERQTCGARPPTGVLLEGHVCYVLTLDLFFTCLFLVISFVSWA